MLVWVDKLFGRICEHEIGTAIYLAELDIAVSCTTYHCTYRSWSCALTEIH